MTMGSPGVFHELWIHQLLWLMAEPRSEPALMGMVILELLGVTVSSRAANKEPLHCDKSAECITRLWGKYPCPVGCPIFDSCSCLLYYKPRGFTEDVAWRQDSE